MYHIYMTLRSVQTEHVTKIVYGHYLQVFLVLMHGLKSYYGHSTLSTARLKIEYAQNTYIYGALLGREAT